MAPRFHQFSFSFEEGEKIPHHEEGFAGAGRDPNLWHIDGYDTFDGSGYPIADNIETLEAAQLLVSARKRRLEETQPSSTSGGSGFGGIQDRTYLIHPRTQG